MKRSFINKTIKENIEFIKRMNFYLPPFAYFTPEEWSGKGAEYNEIRENMLGWDMTDYGGGDYWKLGLFLFTIRNGNLKKPDNKKTYAEKLLVVNEKQVTPMHFHWSKMEDIINRGGGNLMVELYNSKEDESLGDTPVTVNIDGRVYNVESGTVVRLEPGESITLPPYQYHSFWGEEGKGTVLVGEVSMVNDDVNDNCFLEKLPRFSKIEEDEAPLYLLCNEYE